MYAVYDKDSERFIAFHESKKVIRIYYTNLLNSHSDKDFSSTVICKLKNKRARKIDNFSALYLVRYNETYVQSAWVEYYGIYTDEFIYEEQLVRDILLRMIECHRIKKKKDVKTISRAIEIVDALLGEDERFTPTIKELKIAESDYSPYMGPNYFQIR